MATRAKYLDRPTGMVLSLLMKLTLKAVVAALCVATTGLFGSLAGEPEKVIALLAGGRAGRER